MAVRYGSLPFIEAITFFKGKLNVPTERWNDVWQAGHNNAFMVAGAMKDDLLNDFRKAVDMAIAEGKSLTWFKKEFKNIVARHGCEHTGKAAWRSKVIYDTNIRQSYNAGRFEQLQHFEFWEYRHGDSLSPRPMHLSWNGLLLAKDDAWWLTHMPQNGWGC
ncbi:MAG: phage head morphogenesis protein, partial [Psychrosphaera sp.]|nr:phage head morphogenesis protein [Psychrosphaera sp.]